MRLPEWMRPPFAATPAKPPSKPPRKPVEPPDAPPTEDPDDEDDEETQDERDERRRFLVLWFRSHLKSPVEHRVEQLTAMLADGELDSQGWAAAFRTLLSDGHAEAASIGRRLAGDLGPFSERDRKAGEAAWAEEDERYFSGFVADIEAKKPRYVDPDGKLNERAVDARAKQYVAAFGSTAHAAFLDSLGKDAVAWRTTPAEHCEPSEDYEFTCPELEEMGPMPADDWPTRPGGMKTPCGHHCLCFMETADGKYSTEGL